ncbi:MAG: WD40 repeat domain-containing protein [Nostoc sp.]|uniref:WD40 repeat domain-containing protein n=1 Tax=Nostoc sp. TaxID=1180 RepID=UPI002FFC84A4
MNTTNLLREIQVEFIQRLNTNQDEELLCSRYEGNYSELKIILLDELKYAREFAWKMVDKFKYQSNNARVIFSNHLKGKLGEIAVKHSLGNYITSVSYEILPSGDGKVDFMINSNKDIGMQVKTRHGNINTQWKFSKDEIEINKVLACVLIYKKHLESQSFNEFESEYRLLMAGFIPTEIIKDKINANEISFQSEESGYFITIKIEDLLHGSGLKNCLKNLEFINNLQWKEYKIQAQGGDICSLIISLTNKTLVTGDSCHYINFWDLENQILQYFVASTRRQTGDGHSGDVTALALSPDNNFFASGSDDKTIKIWDYTTKSLLKTLKGHSKSVYSLVYSFDGKRIFSGSSDQTVKAWKLPDFEIEFTIDVKDNLNSIKIHPRGEILATAGKDKNISFWRVSSQHLLCKLSAHEEQIMDICFSSNGLILASCSNDKTIKILNTSHENLINGLKPHLKFIKLHENYIYAITISPDCKLLASIDGKGTVYLYEIETGQLICKYPEQLQSSYSRTHAIAFSLDGKLLVAVAKRVIRVWQQVN